MTIGLKFTTPPGSGITNLAGYYLSDELDNPLKFQMPASIINPGEYFIIWCDEEQTEGANHANFKLPSEGGETITLANSQAVFIDAFFLPSQN